MIKINLHPKFLPLMGLIAVALGVLWGMGKVYGWNVYYTIVFAICIYMTFKLSYEAIQFNAKMICNKCLKPIDFNKDIIVRDGIKGHHYHHKCYGEE